MMNMEKFDRAVRVVTAIAVTSIAIKMWITPEIPLRKDFFELSAMREAGVPKAEIDERRKQLYMNLPYVFVQGGDLRVSGSVSID